MSQASDMVWIVDETANIKPDFPWHYRPSAEGKNFMYMSFQELVNVVVEQFVGEMYV